jgi:hypothetical protein
LCGQTCFQLDIGVSHSDLTISIHIILLWASLVGTDTTSCICLRSCDLGFSLYLYVCGCCLESEFASDTYSGYLDDAITSLGILCQQLNLSYYYLLVVRTKYLWHLFFTLVSCIVFYILKWITNTDTYIFFYFYKKSGIRTYQSTMCTNFFFWTANILLIKIGSLYKTNKDP